MAHRLLIKTFRDSEMTKRESVMNLKVQRVFARIFWVALIMGLVSFIWLLFEGYVLDSSDPNIGISGIALLGLGLALMTGVCWCVMVLVSHLRFKNIKS